MAKRGRKKLNKVTQLSTADKGHLSRILKKVRQIKQNKVKIAGATPNAAANVTQLQQLLFAAQQAYNNFISRGLNLTTSTNQNTLNLLAANVNRAAEALNAALAGK